MTVLKEYQRLEASGIWHASPSEQRRDVLVSLGDATLTISDFHGTALSHWSLPAVERVNPGQSPAIYGPGPEVPEVLELEDATMVAAIERVLGAIRRRRPGPARIRRTVTTLAVLAALVAAGFWLPGALVRQAVAVVPQAQRTAIGEAMLLDVRRIAGTPCNTGLGRQALDRLYARLLPGRPGRIEVMPGSMGAAEHLPGGLILLSRSVVEDNEDPAAAAGYVLAEAEAAMLMDPLKRLLDGAGALASLRLLATGKLSDAVLSRAAQAMIASPLPNPPPQPLLARFAEAAVPTLPYAYAVDPTGETTLPLIEANPVDPVTARPVLSDTDWVSLQGICGD